jgi:hypothetical protein
MWDKAALDVNVYGAALRMLERLETSSFVMKIAGATKKYDVLREYFQHLPISGDPRILGDYIAFMSRKTVSVDSTASEWPNWTDDFRRYQDYFDIGLPTPYMAEYKNAQISADEAKEWMRQGVLGVDHITKVSTMLDQHPTMPLGFAVWWSQMPTQSPITPDFGSLPPISPSQDISTGEDMTNSREATLSAAVVPADWWINDQITIDESSTEESLVL